jgi:hypothetical protein
VRQKKKPLARKPEVDREADPRKAYARRNALEPQVMMPHRSDMPLARPEKDEVVVPAMVTGKSLISGRH